MKKILLLSAVLLGAASASQAGVRLNLGFGLPLPPLPPLPGIVFSRPAPRVYYQAPPVCEAPPTVYYQPPVCYDPPVVVETPSLYFGFGPRYGYRGGDYRGYQNYRGGYRNYRGGYDGHYRGHYDGRGGRYDGHNHR